MTQTPTIRMLVLDIDGTLLRPDRTISPAVREAVQWAAAGMPVVLASARPPRSVRAIYHELGLSTPQINYNGALTWDASSGSPIDHVPLAPMICSRLITAARGHLSHAVLGVEHLDRWYTDRLDDRYATETAKLFPPDFVGGIDQFSHLGATKLMFHAEPDEIDGLRAVLEASFRDEVTFIRTDPDLLQMMNRSTSKWRAIVALAGRLGIDPSSILAIGDNENDVEMIGGAGVGVAMANACRPALDVARWVCPSNTDDGVAVAIRRFIVC